MELSEKIRIRDTEIQRAWDNVQNELQHLREYVDIAKQEYIDLQQKLQKAEAMEFQIYKNAQRLNCTEIL